jgi:hypothetical protein
MLLRACEVCEVPESTLKDNVNGKEQNTEKLVSIGIDSKPLLPYTLENELVSYCIVMGNTVVGLTAKDVKRMMAFQLATESWHFVRAN